MAGAAGLLLPVRREEPFGLVAVEAQAAGCPVVAFDRGGVREAVSDGRTGFVVHADDLGRFVEAIRRLPELDRTACRAWARDRFGLDAMISAHEAQYEGSGARGQVSGESFLRLCPESPICTKSPGAAQKISLTRPPQGWPRHLG